MSTSDNELRHAAERLEWKYLVIEMSRHGRLTLYARHKGRKVRLHETPGTIAFLVEFRRALRSLSTSALKKFDKLHNGD